MFHLNAKIKVKLTDFGKEIYYHRIDEAISAGARGLKPSFPEVDGNGCTDFILGEFIKMYGPYIDAGAPAVLEDLNLYIEETSLKGCNK